MLHAKFCVALIPFIGLVHSFVQNSTCPTMSPREIDLKGLDGRWYLTAAATDLEMAQDCAMVLFNHKTDNTTNISIGWMSNNTMNFYNGSVALTPDLNNNGTGDLLLITYTDKKAESYYVLDVNYENYAVVLACDNNDDGSSTYELWKMSRTPHLKNGDADKINRVLNAYNLTDTEFMTFQNTEALCKTNDGGYVNPSSIILTSAAALSLFRRMY